MDEGMDDDLTPMRWPAEWKDPSALEVLKGTAINCLLVESDAASDPVIARAVPPVGCPCVPGVGAYVGWPASGVGVNAGWSVSGVIAGCIVSETGAWDDGDVPEKNP